MSPMIALEKRFTVAAATQFSLRDDKAMYILGQEAEATAEAGVRI